jgi:hypothetical protein
MAGRTSDQARVAVPGQWRRHVGEGNRRKHGRPAAAAASDRQPETREGRLRAVSGGGEAHSTEEAP